MNKNSINELNVIELENVAGGMSWRDLEPGAFYEVVNSMTASVGFDVTQEWVAANMDVSKEILFRRHVCNKDYKGYWADVALELYYRSVC